MCSSGVCVERWVAVRSRVRSICSELFDRRRISCVSVVILVGMRLRTAIFSGRMS